MQVNDPKLQNPFHILAFSHGYRPSDKTPPVHKNPGPGTYNIKPDSPSSSGLKFQTSHRHDFAKEKMYIPGPGSYEIPSPTQADLTKSWSVKVNTSTTFSQIGSLSPVRKSPLLELKSVVSQDTAETSLTKSQIRPRKQNNSYSFYTISNNPGPGTYDVAEKASILFKQHTGTIIGNSERDILNVKTAVKEGISGPAYYSYNNNDSIGLDSPKLSFTKGDRPKLGSLDDFPGPGTYNTIRQENNDQTPLDKTFGTSPRVMMGSLARSDSPGPAYYDNSLPRNHNNLALIKSDRPQNLNGDPRVPGPGTYTILDEFDLKKREADKKNSLQKLMQQAKSTLSEGVLDFSVTSLCRAKSNASSFSLDQSASLYSGVFSELPSEPKGVRPTWVDGYIANNPSPGPVYHAKNNNIEANKRGFKFKNTARLAINEEDIRRNNPGPGVYHLPEIDVGRHTFAKRRRPSNVLVPEHLRKNPGPADYEKEVENKIKGGLFNREDRHLT